MTKQHKAAGVALTLLGIYITIYSLTKLDVGSISKPGSGFFTLICGSGITILSIIWVVTGFLKESDDTPFWEKGQWVKPVIALGLTTLYAILMSDPVGYITATVIFLVLWSILIGRQKPLATILFAILGTGGMYLVFEVLLSVPLPNGWLGI